MNLVACEKLILSALEEDKGSVGDITSTPLIDKSSKSIFQLIVNEDAILGGMDVFKKTFELIDSNILVDSKFNNGDSVKRGNIVCNVSGNTLGILFGERTSLNYISHLSGIATVTRELVELLKDTKTVLLDTRKTTPNLRFFEKESIRSGGAKNHRFDLSEMILIKDNHIAVAGGVRNAILSEKKAYGEKYKIEIEVKNFDELKEAISCTPDIIMFDNWTVEDLKIGCELVPKSIITEASGLINKENIKAYAKCGVSYISTSYMVKNSRWIDFSLNAVN